MGVENEWMEAGQKGQLDGVDWWRIGLAESTKEKDDLKGPRRKNGGDGGGSSLAKTTRDEGRRRMKDEEGGLTDLIGGWEEARGAGRWLTATAKGTTLLHEGAADPGVKRAIPPHLAKRPPLGGHEIPPRPA
ncbi:hypothetical protein PIB30_048661 [Stylosanthes scabra]|uniref:Uncharacterized protein n=1 Tax=Stylosanthes scabra TaxID=79078 RepID=A0ABU6YFX0_9FABA|nr:hypothetical protein [Stylosanthes scabra]